MLQVSFTVFISIWALLVFLLQLQPVAAANAVYLPLPMDGVTPYDPNFCRSHNDYEECYACDTPCTDNRNNCCGSLHLGSCLNGECKCGSAYSEQMEDMSTAYFGSEMLEQTNYPLPRRFPDIISSSFF
ncbi:hypothetical protein BJV82DRAFT_624336 [Fennellomyces sp. T-0311]|nr:hypothetical protein BJV82DRAFT_624336 [Fennellomyces sp. T-0311]